MSFLNLVEEAAGAFAADKLLEKVDPNAGFLAKAAAAVAGFEGVSAVQDHFENQDDDQENARDNDQDDDNRDSRDNDGNNDEQENARDTDDNQDNNDSDNNDNNDDDNQNG